MACAIPSSPAISRGPQPVRSRASHTRSWTASADPAGLAMRRRGPILRPRSRRPLGLARLPIAIDPILHRRHAHPSLARRFAARHPLIKTKSDQLDPLPSPAATYACPASGLMTSEPWICEKTHSFCLSPDAFCSATPRSERPEARHLAAAQPLLRPHHGDLQTGHPGREELLPASLAHGSRGHARRPR